MREAIFHLAYRPFVAERN